MDTQKATHIRYFTHQIGLDTNMSNNYLPNFVRMSKTISTLYSAILIPADVYYVINLNN